MNRQMFALLFACVLFAPSLEAQSASSAWTTPSAQQINAVYPEVESLYLELHRTPELAMQEQRTAAKLAERVRSLGYEVTTGVGGTMASADSVELTVFGRGGHGGRPQDTVDPIVIAARTVLALQTIVSRENNPLDPVVITVGAIHGGTKNSIIPDEVKMLMTVRTYKPETRKRVLASIERVAKGESMAGAAPRDPLVTVIPAYAPTIRTAMIVETTELLELLGH